ncbi:hypothetical protein [Streptomyces rugosispiralis]|uniref:Uncharacterized protein n=1 Tax=Streptomyces rugosispiralis TaxID=2967341 RepID=A0ABT1VFC7_9ACTN|nr:hypothetical protein [Streptomyces rugosispiralis]MCQ8195226.1 hypothetical protein [Streptomyces rugosispiralis]
MSGVNTSRTIRGQRWNVSQGLMDETPQVKPIESPGLGGWTDLRRRSEAGSWMVLTWPPGLAREIAWLRGAGMSQATGVLDQ